ncbi:hypothetical protein CVT26_008124, partial [Gymnopilus dilepis]
GLRPGVVPDLQSHLWEPSGGPERPLLVPGQAWGRDVLEVGEKNSKGSEDMKAQPRSSTPIPHSDLSHRYDCPHSVAMTACQPCRSIQENLAPCVISTVSRQYSFVITISEYSQRDSCEVDIAPLTRTFPSGVFQKSTRDTSQILHRKKNGIYVVNGHVHVLSRLDTLLLCQSAERSYSDASSLVIASPTTQWPNNERQHIAPCVADQASSFRLQSLSLKFLSAILGWLLVWCS